MGAWGAGTFENDDALDWVGDVADAPGAARVVGALATAANLHEDDYLESPECAAALCAAEMVAAQLGRPRADLPEEVEQWVAANPGPPASEMLRLARAAVARVKNDSEMRELWEESDSYAEWQTAIADLEGRLES